MRVSGIQYSAVFRAKNDPNYQRTEPKVQIVRVPDKKARLISNAATIAGVLSASYLGLGIYDVFLKDKTPDLSGCEILRSTQLDLNELNEHKFEDLINDISAKITELPGKTRIVLKDKEQMIGFIDAVDSPNGYILNVKRDEGDKGIIYFSNKEKFEKMKNDANFDKGNLFLGFLLTLFLLRGIHKFDAQKKTKSLISDLNFVFDDSTCAEWKYHRIDRKYYGCDEPVSYTIDDIQDDYGTKVPYKIIAAPGIDNVIYFERTDKKNKSEKILSLEVINDSNNDSDAEIIHMKIFDGNKIFDKNISSFTIENNSSKRGINDRMLLAVLREIIKLKSGDFD